MHAPTRRLARDPLRLSRRRRNLAVERHRRLERDERQPLRHPFDIRFIERARLFRQHAHRHFDARRFEHRLALSCDERIRVEHRGDDALDARLDERLGARPRAAVMRARLQRHIGGRAARKLARHGERVHLGVRRARLAMPARTDDAPLAHEDGTDERIRRGAATRIRSEQERLTHEVLVLLHLCASFLFLP